MVWHIIMDSLQSLLSMKLLTTFTASVGLLYWYLTYHFNHWKKKGVPYVEPNVFFGNLKGQVLLRISSGELIQNYYNQFKGHRYFGLFRFRKPALLIRDPELIKLVLVKNFSNFHDRGTTYDKKSPLSAHLINLGGDTWRQLRMKLTPTFTSGKIKMMFNIMSECAVELTHLLSEDAKRGEAVEVKEAVAKYTTDVIGTCAFGLQFNSMKDPNSEFRSMGRKVFEPSVLAFVRRILTAVFPSLASFLQFRSPSNEITNFFVNAVRETVDYREKNNVQRNDFMQLLIQLKNKGKVEEAQDTSNGKELTDTHKRYENEHEDLVMDEIMLTSQAFVFFLAGFETSSTTMGFSLYELAMNPGIQERLQEEIDTVLAETGGNLTYDAVQKMDYLDKVVAETLRKYPPAHTLVRRCNLAFKIPDSNVVIEEGDDIMISVMGLHHDPKYYPEPERFDPERFSEENKAKRPHFAYLPFGEGPRICIGMRFGLVQTKLGLAALLHRYSFKPSKKTPKRLKFEPKSILTASVGGNWLHVVSRQ